MAEAAGLVLGALGVAGLFSVCVQAFDMVQVGRTQTHRLRILATKLDNQKARFIIWGKALGLDNEQEYDTRLDDPLRKERIRRSCELIYDLFTKSSLLTTRYGLQPETGPGTSDVLQLNSHEGSAWKMTFRRMRTHLSSTDPQNQHRSHVTRWVIQDQKEFLELVQDLRELIDDLEELTAFRDVRERQRVITTYEVESIPDDGSIRILHESTVDEPGMILEAASMRASARSRTTGPGTFYTASEGRGAAEGSDMDTTSAEDLGTLALEKATSDAVDVVPQHERIMRSLGPGPSASYFAPFGNPSAGAHGAREVFSRVYSQDLEAYQNDDIWVPRTKRLSKELRDHFEGERLPSSEFVTFAAIPGSPTKFRGTILGPAQTPYESGVFHLLLLFPNDHPFRPPLVRFLTRVYHPNVDPKGKICLNILEHRDGWNPALRMFGILASITALLSEPVSEDPLVPEIASTFITDRQLYDDNARAYTRRYATGAFPSQDEVANLFNAMERERQQEDVMN